MHVERCADAVARAVKVVQPDLPQGCASKGVDRRSGGALGEDDHVQGDQHRLAIHGCRILGDERVVVDDCAVGVGAGDGGKGQIEEAGLRRAKARETRGQLCLCQRVALDLSAKSAREA
eukprot:2626561-Pleurochrysis_carterae.AAC.1